MLEFRNEEQQTQEKGVFLCLVLMKNNQTHKNCNCIEGFDLMASGWRKHDPRRLAKVLHVVTVLHTFLSVRTCCSESPREKEGSWPFCFLGLLLQKVVLVSMLYLKEENFSLWLTLKDEEGKETGVQSRRMPGRVLVRSFQSLIPSTENDKTS